MLDISESKEFEGRRKSAEREVEPIKGLSSQHSAEIMYSTMNVLGGTMETQNQDKVLYYEEYNSGRRMRHRLNFGTPRTQEAAAKVGLSYEDCVKKSKLEFFLPGCNIHIAQIKYDHHLQRVQEALERIYFVRRDILRRENLRRQSVEKELINLINKKNKEKVEYRDELLSIFNPSSSVDRPMIKNVLTLLF